MVVIVGNRAEDVCMMTSWHQRKKKHNIRNDDMHGSASLCLLLKHRQRQQPVSMSGSPSKQTPTYTFPTYMQFIQKYIRVCI